MSKTEEALLPIIAEMKAIVDREKDASGHVSRKSVAKYFQAFVTKLEHLPRTPEGQEIEDLRTGKSIVIPVDEEHARNMVTVGQFYLDTALNTKKED